MWTDFNDSFTVSFIDELPQNLLLYYLAKFNAELYNVTVTAILAGIFQAETETFGILSETRDRDETLWARDETDRRRLQFSRPWPRRLTKTISTTK